MDDRTRAFADINGLRLYYEIHGRGRPVVLLHGGLLTIDFMFGPLLPTLAARRQVSPSSCRVTDALLDA